MVAASLRENMPEMLHRRPFFAVTAAFVALIPLASLPGQTPSKSAPIAKPLNDATPLPQDAPYPGTMQIDVDASDIARRIYRVKQTIPLASGGPMTLLFPQWLPGTHSPRGQIDKLSGLKITADGVQLSWRRDPLDVYAFHLDVPSGAKSIVAEFQYLTPTASNQGRIVVTDKMMNLQWEAVSLYPAGYYVRRIPVQATVTYPVGWTAASALRGEVNGATVRYEPTDYETLIDSPVIAGKYTARHALGRDVALNLIADNEEELKASAEQIAAHKKLVTEAITLFGARHFDRYDFLLAISDELGGMGLEHHRSSENGVDTGYFSNWADTPGDRNLLPHELVHSWDGKFRRPESLWTPDYRTPMQDDLLWVYEGQTQFWGYVLGARSGLYTKQQTLDAYASIAARLDTAKGREWRPMGDTTNDPIISARRPKGWTSWQRAEDYYNEGLLMWLEADAIIAKASKGTRGLDHFAKAFFGMRDGDWGQLTYTKQDVIDALNAVQPYDWAGFLAQRVDRTSAESPKGGLKLGGYALTYTETPNSMTKQIEKDIKGIDQIYGVGLAIKNDGEIQTVIWDSAAFKAGLTVGMKIFAVNGAEYTSEGFKAALTQAKDPKKPIELIVRQDKSYRIIRLDYSSGLRYPQLQKTGEGEGSLDRLLKPRT
jgi:predicted metalloprotease with PDZ domain